MKTNRNVHASGALGRLLNSGQITKVNDNDSPTLSEELKNLNRMPSNYFRTTSGVEFRENELLLINPEECQPWKYANRQAEEMADIEELMNSIKRNQQLQPGLVRPLSTPIGKIKYEIIFGRRRHYACLKLGIPFLAIQKELSDVQDAIITQDAENKERKDVSNYSNAILYKKLLDDSVFKNGKELASKLNISTSSFTDLMAFTRIPSEVIERIPSIHSLSTIMAVKIASHARIFFEKLLEVAPSIGVTITSPAKLASALKTKTVANNVEHSSNIFKNSKGQVLFSYKSDSKGRMNFQVDSKLKDKIDINEICQVLKNYLEKIK